MKDISKTQENVKLCNSIPTDSENFKPTIDSDQIPEGCETLTEEERREKVSKLIEQEYPDIHPIAKKLLVKYPETCHLPGTKFCGVKSLFHHIKFKGPIYFSKQYKTPPYRGCLN